MKGEVSKGRQKGSATLPPKDRLLKITKEYRESFPPYARNCLKLQNVKGQLVPFELNEIQRIVHFIINDNKKYNKLTRVVILKARRFGISTYTGGRFFWKTSMNKNRYAMIVAHEPQATDFLFKMQKRFYNNLPVEFKPETRYNNKTMVEFNNEKNTGLDSTISVGTAGKADFGSAQTIHYLHLSELSKYPKATTSSLLLSLLQTVPDEPGTEIIIESTAKGIGGEFYNRYRNSRFYYEIYLDKDYKARARRRERENTSKENNYISIFIPWFAFSEYEMDVPDDFVPTKEELELKKRYNLTDRKLQWRRYAIVNKCDNNIENFHQEYPSNEVECFVSSGNSPFDVEKLMKLKENAPKPIAKYKCNLTTQQFFSDKDGSFWVWKEPMSKRYLVSADVAEGLELGDYSSADVIDLLTGEQVAHWHGHIAADMFGILLVSIAMRYNDAMIVPERNNMGVVVINKIMDMGYKNIYVETVIEPPAKPRKRYGWVTSKKTKYPIIDNLASEVRDNTHGINCEYTLAEMITFKQNEDGTLGAEVGEYDDRVMSVAIGKYVRTRLPMTIKNNAPNRFNPRIVPKREPASAIGWV